MSYRRPFTRRAFLRSTGTVLLAAPVLPAIRASETFASAAGTDPILVEKYCQTMGAIASISVYGYDRRFCEDAIATAFAEMRRTDKLMSSYDPASALNGVNRAAGLEEVAVSPEVVGVMESARQYHAATGGAFDVTIGPLLELYGFFEGRDSGTFPDDRTIAETLEGVGFGKVRIEAACSAVGLLHPRSRIDLGGIGVGHALDRAALVLRKRGIESALLNHSGDILAIGAPPDAAGWKIGIQDPQDPRGTVESFTLKDRSVSTSGNYENFIETDRGRIGHILDPATGRSSSLFLSVSVMADSSLAADALSTGFFAGGVRLSAPAPSEAGRISVYSISAGDGHFTTDYNADVRA